MCACNWKLGMITTRVSTGMIVFVALYLSSTSGCYGNTKLRTRGVWATKTWRGSASGLHGLQLYNRKPRNDLKNDCVSAAMLLT